MTDELNIFQEYYDLMLWTLKHTEKFPRHHRYSLGYSIEKRMQDILDLFLEARYNPVNRQACLKRVNIQVHGLRFQFRLAKDMGILPIKSHGYAADVMEKIGSQIGGWLRSVK